MTDFKTGKSVSKQVLLLSIGIGLLYFAFRGQPFSEIWKTLEGAHFWVLIPIVLVSFLGHIVRALRWKMLIRPLGYVPSFYIVFNTLMTGYLVNYAIPRFGEIVRCATLRQKEDIPFTTLFGTVMTERLIDLILLAIGTLMAFLFQFRQIKKFFAEHIFIPIYNKIDQHILSNKPVLVILVLTAAYLLYLLFKSRKKAMDKINSSETDKFVLEVWSGLTTFSKVENKLLLIVYSVVIWIGYFLTTYLCFFAFDETLNLDLQTGLSMMVIGSFGRSVPIQGGGMGAYHYVVAKALVLFGVGSATGTAYAVLNHGIQTVYQLVAGGVCLLLLIFTGKKISLTKF